MNTATQTDTENRAQQQAIAQAQSISEMVAALDKETSEIGRAHV